MSNDKDKSSKFDMGKNRDFAFKGDPNLVSNDEDTGITRKMEIEEILNSTKNEETADTMEMKTEEILSYSLSSRRKIETGLLEFVIKYKQFSGKEDMGGKLGINGDAYAFIERQDIDKDSKEDYKWFYDKHKTSLRGIKHFEELLETYEGD